MGSLVTPSVYFIGYTTIDCDGLDAYLRDSGNEDFLESIAAARKEGLSDGEILVSFFAKLCYASLTLGKNLNVTRVRDIPDNLRACWDQGHGSVWEHVQLNFVVRNCSRVFTHEIVRHRAGTAFCLAGDAEVYCGRGKKPDGTGSWNGVKKRTIRDLYERYTHPDHRRRSRVKLMRVRCYDGAQFVMAPIKNVIKSGVKPLFEVKLSNGGSIRCSWDHRFLSRRGEDEGWFSLRHLRAGDSIATNGRRIVRPDRQALYRQYVEQDMTREQVASLYGVSEPLVGKWLRHYGIAKPGGGRFQKGLTPWNRGVTGVVTFSLSDEACRKIAAAKLGENNPNWKGGLSVREQNARRLRKNTCEECGSGDDLHVHHKDRDHWNDAPENLTTLCNSCHVKLHNEQDGNPRALVPRWREIVSVEPVGEGMTYDLEVDHPAHNFVANGFVTHNSQTSGRYVRGDEVNVVFDPILEPVRDDVRELQALIEERYAGMVRKMGLDAMKDFGRKKKITSALRRLLPNGQSNEIGFSCNLRALRHTVQLRTSRHAEWEIRDVFGQVYRMTKERYPLLYHGAREEVVDGLVEVSGMRMQPYSECSECPKKESC